jgi:hypothetical protein
VVASSCADAALAARSAAHLMSRARRRLVYVMPHMTSLRPPQGSARPQAKMPETERGMA